MTIPSSPGLTGMPPTERAIEILEHQQRMAPQPLVSPAPRSFMESVMAEAAELSSLRQLRQVTRWHLLVCEEETDPMHTDYGSVEELIEGLRSLVAAKVDARVYIFRGQRLHISRGPFKYLLDGDTRTPLFASPEQSEIEVSGSLLDQGTNDSPLPPAS